MNNEELAETLFWQLKPTTSTSLTESLNEFNRGEVGVLSYLAFDKGEVTAGELSEKLKVTTARIASILNSLEAKKYVTRKIDPNDKRKTLVTITELGMELAINTKKEIISKIVKVINEVGSDYIKEYIKISSKIRDVLDKQ